MGPESVGTGAWGSGASVWARLSPQRSPPHPCFAPVSEDNQLEIGGYKEMIYLPAILPFFKIHVNQVLARDDSPAANIISMHVVGEAYVFPLDSGFRSVPPKGSEAI